MKNLLLVLLGIIIINPLVSEAKRQVSPYSYPIQTPADRIYMPYDQVRETESAVPYLPRQPHRDDFIGDRFEAGDTWYDYQSNGTIGKMIAKDSDGGIHITWMDGNNANLGAGNRDQKYNYFIDNQWIENDGVAINQVARGGYGTITLTKDNPQRALSIYHAGDGDAVRGFAAVDFFAGAGAFISVALPRYVDQSVIWPQGVMSNEGKIHVVYNRRDAGMVSYARGSTNQDGDPVFNQQLPIQVGETHLNSYRIAVSRNSERTAITWLAPRSGNPADENWDGFLAYQLHNDLMLAWSDDGVNWNFDNPLNVTNNIPPDPNRQGRAAYGDTLFPYNNHDIIFDHDDNIHIAFDTRYLAVQPIPETVPPVDGLTVDASFLFHWSEETNEITAVADGWYSQQVLDDNGEITKWPTPGAWKSNVCAPSLAIADNGDIYCVFNYYPTDDYSNEDYCNGDIAATVSEDGGRSWYKPTMITTTTSLMPERYGESLCEVYPTVVEVADEFLHISYELDSEPGSTIQDYDGRNEVSSLCLWYYHKVPVDLIAREEIYEGPNFHMSLAPNVANIRRDIAAPTPDQEVTVSATITSSTGDLGIPVLEYSVNEGNVVSVDMQNAGNNVYNGTIPSQANGSNVWYRILATDEGGETIAPEGWWHSYWVRADGELTIKDVQWYPNDWSVDYSPYKDYEITLTGVLTSNSQFADVYGAYSMQDAEEYWSGIFLKGIDEDLQSSVEITVTGIVRETDANEPTKWRFQTYIEVTDYEVLGQTTPINPLEVSVSDLRYATRAEHLEGVLVTINDVEVQVRDPNDALYNQYLPISQSDTDDMGWFTVYGLLDGDIQDLEIETFRHGTTIEWLTGVFTENERYAIAPRSPEDFGSYYVKEERSELPSMFELYKPYPNPFNNTVKVGFNLPIAGFVNLGVYDLQGRLVDTIVSKELTAGHWLFQYQAQGVANGIYIIKLESNTETASQKVVLLK